MRIGGRDGELPQEGEERGLWEAGAVEWEQLRILMGDEEGAVERGKWEEGGVRPKRRW